MVLLLKLVICVINGYVFGGGLEFVFVVDICIMVSEIKVGFIEFKFGIILGVGGM